MKNDSEGRPKAGLSRQAQQHPKENTAGYAGLGMPSVPLVKSPHAEPRRTLSRRITSGWKKLKEIL